jgi:predicted ester cyclase
MKGTNSGSFNALPPTGTAITLPGADFVRVEEDKIRSVQGYFDSISLPRALGLDVIVQPK